MSDNLNFHLTTPFGMHVPSDGSHIADGAPDPVNCGAVLGVPGFPTGLLVFNDGVKFAAMEIYAHLPYQVGYSRLQFDFDVTDAGDFYRDGWTHETDTIICVSGRKFNLSVQRLAKNNMIQLSDQNGHWVDSGFIAPPLVQGVPLHHTYVYGLDTQTGRYATETITIGGQFLLVPFELQECQATATTWPDGVTGQVQNALGPNGGKLRLLYDHLSYSWTK